MSNSQPTMLCEKKRFLGCTKATWYVIAMITTFAIAVFTSPLWAGALQPFV